MTRKILNILQYNIIANGMTLSENNGKIHMDVIKKVWWFHTPSLYNSYDTFSKMRRYRKDWVS